MFAHGVVLRDDGCGTVRPRQRQPADWTNERALRTLEAANARDRATSERADNRIGLEQPRQRRVATRRVSAAGDFLLENDSRPAPGAPERPGRGRAGESSAHNDNAMSQSLLLPAAG